ncbi:oligosaccharide flippase family protein [Maribellus sp. YY47]|nr:oligosaccharide flippase family protein [Maribellus sp. YY47]
MPIFTRILSTSDYGIIAIYQTFVNIFIIVATISLEQSVRHIYLREKHIFKEFTGSVLNFLLLFNILFIGILWMIQKDVVNIFELQKGLFLYALLNILFGGANAIYNMYLMASQQSKKFMLIQVISALFIPLIAIPLILKANKELYLWRIIPQVLITGVLAIYSSYSLIKISKFTLKINHVKRALKFSLPLLPHFLATFILVQFDRIAINKIIDSSATGIYSFGYSLGSILNAVFASTNAAWLPIFYKNLKNKEYDFVKMKMISYVKLILFISALMIIFSKEAIWILADEKFYSAINLVPSIVLGISFTFLFTIYVSYLYYIEKTKLIPILTIAAGVLNIVLNILFIPVYGIIAAAVTTLVSYILLFVLTYLSVKKSTETIKEGFLGFNLILKYLIVLTIVGILFHVLNVAEINYLILLAVKVVVLPLVMLLFFKRSDIDFIKQLITKKQ